MVDNEADIGNTDDVEQVLQSLSGLLEQTTMDLGRVAVRHYTV